MKRLESWERPDKCEERGAGRRSGGLPGLCLLLLLTCCFTVTAQDLHQNDKNAPLPDLPEATSPVALSAVNDPVTGKSAFSFDGKEIPPVIRSAPGSKIQIEYLNKMSRSSKEVCVDRPCMNMTNLHFHGLHVSPNAPTM
jgi:FtsP/CotA-like multicopper oxidase with cupredoxin domain